MNFRLQWANNVCFKSHYRLLVWKSIQFYGVILNYCRGFISFHIYVKYDRHQHKSNSRDMITYNLLVECQRFGSICCFRVQQNCEDGDRRFIRNLLQNTAHDIISQMLTVVITSNLKLNSLESFYC
jgi:hypothetical protein